MGQNEKKLKIACLIVSGLIVLFFLIFLYQLIPYSSIEISQTDQIEEKPFSQPQKNKESIFESALSSKSSETKTEELNILILGRPGQNYPGQDLTDTIILAHLKPNEKKAILISLPRDLLINPSNQDQSIKINSLYQLAGIEPLKEKIKEIIGLNIDYYILIDLKVVKEMIDLIDGLNVFVPQDINDPYFPGPNYSYQAFVLQSGWRYLDGETALKYIRTRYTSPDGDFDRMARQQQIIHLLKQKALSLNPLWNLPTYLKIFNTLKDHIETDLGLLEIKSLWQITKELQADQIISLVIDKKQTDLLVNGQVMIGRQIASVVWPKTGQGNYKEIKKYIRKFID